MRRGAVPAAAAPPSASGPLTPPGLDPCQPRAHNANPHDRRAPWKAILPPSALPIPVIPITDFGVKWITESGQPDHWSERAGSGGWAPTRTSCWRGTTPAKTPARARDTGTRVPRGRSPSPCRNRGRTCRPRRRRPPRGGRASSRCRASRTRRFASWPDGICPGSTNEPGNLHRGRVVGGPHSAAGGDAGSADGRRSGRTPARSPMAPGPTFRTVRSDTKA